jgi:hypothetical protein
LTLRNRGGRDGFWEPAEKRVAYAQRDTCRSAFILCRAPAAPATSLALERVPCSAGLQPGRFSVLRLVFRGSELQLRQKHWREAPYLSRCYPARDLPKYPPTRLAQGDRRAYKYSYNRSFADRYFCSFVLASIRMCDDKHLGLLSDQDLPLAQAQLCGSWLHPRREARRAALPTQRLPLAVPFLQVFIPLLGLLCFLKLIYLLCIIRRLIPPPTSALPHATSSHSAPSHRQDVSIETSPNIMKTNKSGTCHPAEQIDFRHRHCVNRPSSSPFRGSELQLRQKGQREAPSSRGAFPATNHPFFAFSTLFAFFYLDTSRREKCHVSHCKQTMGTSVSRHTQKACETSLFVAHLFRGEALSAAFCPISRPAVLPLSS